MIKDQRTKNIRILYLLIAIVYLFSLFFLSLKFPDSKTFYIDVLSSIFNVCLLFLVLFKVRKGYKLNPKVFLGIAILFMGLKVVELLYSWFFSTKNTVDYFDVINYTPIFIFTTLILSLFQSKSSRE